ncbi:hypothetical protein PE067_13570 [Paracoccus sp. DMF-8]|uniref:hypothetical protein n=1 Tax=Paracoccus sp. DMF-8 TaxID=3019445 RepID=UPI0023E77F2D|nr:hypothetical protein [Paracoccus sp. DMF-8]MDF3607068.1 hypothetical protein [Paracoccus sp. DMF-8]
MSARPLAADGRHHRRCGAATRLLGLLRGAGMARDMPVQEVARASNLTRSEALLALHLADGSTLADAAKELGLDD